MDRRVTLPHLPNVPYLYVNRSLKAPTTSSLWTGSLSGEKNSNSPLDQRPVHRLDHIMWMLFRLSLIVHIKCPKTLMKSKDFGKWFQKCSLWKTNRFENAPFADRWKQRLLKTKTEKKRRDNVETSCLHRQLKRIRKHQWAGWKCLCFVFADMKRSILKTPISGFGAL